MNLTVIIALALLLALTAALTWVAARAIAQRDRALLARDSEHNLRQDVQQRLAELQERHEDFRREHDDDLRRLAIQWDEREAALRAELTPKPRPARLKLEDEMPPEQLAELLRGTAGLPAVRAVLALVKTQLVELSDRATDAPRETIALPDRTLAPYTAEMRLHDAGGAAHLAELLSRLQDLTAAREPAPAEEQRAA